MGHLTAVRYKYELGGKPVTPRQLYGEAEAKELYAKAAKVVNFAKKLSFAGS